MKAKLIDKKSCFTDVSPNQLSFSLLADGQLSNSTEKFKSEMLSLGNLHPLVLSDPRFMLEDIFTEIKSHC